MLLNLFFSINCKLNTFLSCISTFKRFTIFIKSLKMNKYWICIPIYYFIFKINCSAIRKLMRIILFIFSIFLRNNKSFSACSCSWGSNLFIVNITCFSTKLTIKWVRCNFKSKLKTIQNLFLKICIRITNINNFFLFWYILFSSRSLNFSFFFII